jgi:Zn-dependent alcohol dehydrogenase
MKTKAAVLFEQPGKWEVVEVDLDSPKAFEVLVEFTACGLFHPGVAPGRRGRRRRRMSLRVLGQPGRAG